jgi:predicted flavoprotein YhiN
LDKKVTVEIDFLPNMQVGELSHFLSLKKSRLNPKDGELLCGILNNQIARAVEKYVSSGSVEQLATAVKKFPLFVTGCLGYDYAQVTKGGVPLVEVDENFQSEKASSLYFSGEILDIDGECGGFNLHFAFASAKTAVAAIEKNCKRRGQV